MKAIVFCFEEGAGHGHPGFVCLLVKGHRGDHDWTKDSEIFIPEGHNPETP